MARKNGFTLVELMVAAVLFSLVVLGFVGVFVASTKHIFHARERMTSAQLGKYYLDPLQIHVRFDTWNQLGNELTPAGPKSGTSQTINRSNFSEQHEVTTVAGTDLRRVVSTISWTEDF